MSFFFLSFFLVFLSSCYRVVAGKRGLGVGFAGLELTRLGIGVGVRLGFGVFDIGSGVLS